MVDDPQAVQGARASTAAHDADAWEPLGPATSDDDTPLGNTPEAHDEISLHDLPVDPRADPALAVGGRAADPVRLHEHGSG